MRNGRYGSDPRLTKEQERIRLSGLRILARIIARAHLRSLIAEEAARSGSVPDSSTSGVAKEDERAG
jgi:hypothetical protein